MSQLREALTAISDRAPQVQVAPGFYARARRRHRLRLLGAAASVVALVGVLALVAPSTIFVGRTSSGVGDGGGPPGIPDRLVRPSATTATVSGDPAGPASVVFSGNVPQADHEDWDLAWWRDGYTVYPSAVVGLRDDRYRIVREGYGSGTELSPDGRFMLVADRQVLDLTTGKTRRLRPSNESYEISGRWTGDGERIVYIEDRVTEVVSWPGLAAQARFEHPEHAPVDQDLALSTDLSMLAVNSNQMLSVYRADGTRAWWIGEEDRPELGRVRIGGREAWRPDGRLVVFARTDLRCDPCGAHPGTWTVTFLDGATGRPETGPQYPQLRDALNVDIVAWRGDVAYATVSYVFRDVSETQGTGDPDRVDLVRLRPGAAEPERVLSAPAGSWGMGVATDHVDVTRVTGEPEFGYNRPEAIGRTVAWLPCLVPFLLALGTFVFGWTRRRRPYRAPAIAPSGRR